MRQHIKPFFTQGLQHGLCKLLRFDDAVCLTITQASGGQLQRVGICRALINKPDILFGDEPTGALNSKAAGEIMDLLTEINNSGTTIMLVTHDVKVAARTERVLFMLDGKIVAEKHLGKPCANGTETKEREERLSSWLTELGF